MAGQHPQQDRVWRGMATVIAIVLVTSVSLVNRAAALYAPTVHLSQATQLYDGQTIQVTVTGLDPTDRVGVRQCAADAPTDSCDPGVAGSASPQGDIELPLTVHEALSDGTNCGTDGACVIRVTYGPDVSGPNQIDTPIQFFIPSAIGLGVDTRTLLVQPDGSATVTGTIYCDPATEGLMTAELHAPDATIVSEGRTVPCGPDRSAWSVDFFGGLNEIPDGRALLIVTFANGGDGGLSTGSSVDVVHTAKPTMEAPHTVPPADVPSAPTAGPPVAAVPVSAQPTFTG